eukprot:295072-Chlamydomonas_euryale.AAC.1
MWGELCGFPTRAAPDRACGESFVGSRHALPPTGHVGRAERVSLAQTHAALGLQAPCSSPDRQRRRAKRVAVVVCRRPGQPAAPDRRLAHCWPPPRPRAAGVAAGD